MVCRPKPSAREQKNHRIEFERPLSGMHTPLFSRGRHTTDGPNIVPIVSPHPIDLALDGIFRHQHVTQNFSTFIIKFDDHSTRLARIKNASQSHFWKPTRLLCVTCLRQKKEDENPPPEIVRDPKNLHEPWQPQKLKLMPELTTLSPAEMPTANFAVRFLEIWACPPKANAD